MTDGKTGHEARTHPKWDASPSQGSMHTYIHIFIHTQGEFIVTKSKFLNTPPPTTPASHFLP